MVWLSNRQVAAIAAHWGHRDLAVLQSRRGWVATCSCGYRSARRQTAALAAEAAAHHMQRIVRDAQNAGVSVTIPRDVTNSPEGKGSSEPAAASNAA